MIQRGTLVRHDFAIRRLTVRSVTELSPHFTRVTLASDSPGDDSLTGLTSLGAADHAKVFFPAEGATEIVAPTVTPEGMSSPEGTVIMRDYTPLVPRLDAGELDLDFFVHGDDGPASAWAARVQPGAPLVVGGPRGSHLAPTGVGRAVLIADETALPALSRWIDTLGGVDIVALVELRDSADAAYLGDVPANVRIEWLPKGSDALTTAVRELGPITDDTYVWGAGESTSLVPVRRYLRRELNLSADQVKLTGYWRQGVVALDHHAPIDPSDPD